MCCEGFKETVLCVCVMWSVCVDLCVVYVGVLCVYMYVCIFVYACVCDMCVCDVCVFDIIYMCGVCRGVCMWYVNSMYGVWCGMCVCIVYIV